jgi:hypothetical protein
MSNKKILIEALKNLNKAKAPAKKADTDYVSKMGYRDDSPFRKRKSITINTRDGIIDMGTPGNGTGIPLLANGEYLPPYSGKYKFDTNEVTEVPLDQAKKGGSKKFSSNLQATNRLFKKNPLFKKKNYKSKTYDPTSMYFQDGGVPYNYNQFISAEPEVLEQSQEFIPIRTKNDPEDYDQFLNYSETAPENRRPNEGYTYGDPNLYDHYGMWETLGKPENFEQALQMNPDWKPDPYDDLYHGYSVNDRTGVFLKSGKPGLKPGDTNWMEVLSHYLSPRAQQDTPVYDPELQRFKYIPNEYIETELAPEEIEEYRKGGFIVEEINDPSIPPLNRAQYGLINKNTTLEFSPYSLNANQAQLASNMAGEYQPEALIGIRTPFRSPDSKLSVSGGLTAGIPYGGKMIPSINVNARTKYRPGKISAGAFAPIVQTDWNAGWDPTQGVNASVNINPRWEFGNRQAGEYKNARWKPGSWKGYFGPSAGASYRQNEFFSNQVLDAIEAEDERGGNFSLDYGAGAGFEARPFRKTPLRLGVDASLLLSPVKAASEKKLNTGEVGWGATPMIKVKGVIPLDELKSDKKKKNQAIRNKKLEDDKIFNRPQISLDSIPADVDISMPNRKDKKVKEEEQYIQGSGIPELLALNEDEIGVRGFLPGFSPETSMPVGEKFTRRRYGQNNTLEGVSFAMGGYVNYSLGDEVDEATKEYLERLGYKFEKI